MSELLAPGSDDRVLENPAHLVLGLVVARENDRQLEAQAEARLGIGGRDRSEGRMSTSMWSCLKWRRSTSS